MPKKMFSLELTFTGITPEDTTTVLKAHLPRSSSGAHSTEPGLPPELYVRDGQLREWCIGSGALEDESDDTLYLCTPDLDYTAERTHLLTLMRGLRKEGAVMDDECNIHIYSDAMSQHEQDELAEEIINILH